MQYANYLGKHDLCCIMCDCLLGHGTGAILCGVLIEVVSSSCAMCCVVTTCCNINSKCCMLFFL